MPNLSHMNDVLNGYSKALYASWFYYRPARLLLDAGEGIIHGLGKKVFGVRQVFLTHGHEDHIAGLPSLVNLRNLSNGDREIPITVHYPKGDPFVGYLREYLDKKQKHRLHYKLNWRPLFPGDSVKVDVARRDTRVTAFPVEHTRHWQSLGYRIEERRQVLRTEYRDAAPAAVKDLIREHGRDAVLKEAWHPLLVYTGDTRPLKDVTPCQNADILMIEATNIDGTESAGLNHSHIDAAFRIAAEAGVKHLVLFHLSGRYSKQEILRGIDKAASRHGRPPKFGYFFERRYFDLTEG
ncbi:MAG: MBL fold metallo-hydrolase [bacterium]|nr:MBL fold metallo-hydrolase [bacterium]